MQRIVLAIGFMCAPPGIMFGQEVIVTGDADQSDLPRSERRLIDVMQRLAAIKGVGVVEFKATDIVRHPIIENVLKELER